jgi:hypothetical protein
VLRFECYEKLGVVSMKVVGDTGCREDGSEWGCVEREEQRTKGQQQLYVNNSNDLKHHTL